MTLPDKQALAGRFPAEKRVALTALIPGHGQVRHWTEWQSRTKRDGSTYVHKALDIDANVGTKLLSPGVGTVVDVGTQIDASTGKGWGNFIKLKFHRSDLVILLAHMNKKSKLKVGDEVNYGDEIGETGQSGTNPPAPHLHIETWYQGTKVPPTSIFNYT